MSAANTSGFFSSAELGLVKPALSRLPQCGKCGLLNRCNSPKMKVDGHGRRKILVVGEQPGKDEDKEGKPFVGATGRLIREALDKSDVDLRRDCWLTNAIICKPGASPGNAVEYCRPNLINTIRDLKPETVILLGADAVRSLIGYTWKEPTGPIQRWVGWQIPDRKFNCWICPTYQPAQLFYEPKDPVLELDFRTHLCDAVGLSGRPWPDGPPDYENAVEVILDVQEASRRIRKYTGGMVSFDYETDRLKPDHRDASIVCASVCWEGQETIAFPWHGEVRNAMRELLTNPDVGKVGWHMQFEDRWSRVKFGEVRGWHWDGMLVAHALDPRGGGKDKSSKESAGVTGLKFQSYVLLGYPDYSSHLDQFLKSKDKSNNAPNRIREVSIRTLCLYCGLDSLLEWEAAQRQMKRLGVA